MKVYFVGAGPGDPELITVKGKKLLQGADVVVYAGSLINARLLEMCKQGSELHDSAAMSLEEVVAIYEAAAASDKAAVSDKVAVSDKLTSSDRVTAGEKVIVRLHSGEPSLYGAIKEQIDWLAARGIAYEVVPGVSSFSAAAASLSTELTLPGLSQTVIITRMPGRTPVPEGQEIHSLAAHGATMCIFLSVQMIDELVAELKAGYPEHTPVAVVERASW